MTRWFTQLITLGSTPSDVMSFIDHLGLRSLAYGVGESYVDDYGSTVQI